MTAIALAVLIAGCSSAPDQIYGCIRMAEDSGVPGPVLDLMERPPAEWEALERLAVRGALEEYGLSTACSDLVSGVESGRRGGNATPAVSPTPASASTTAAPVPPQIPFPSPAPTQPSTLSEPTPLALDSPELASQLRRESPHIYDALSRLEWVADGISRKDVDDVKMLITLGAASPFSAEVILGMDWVVDELSDEEAWAIAGLGLVAEDSPGDIEGVVQLSWMADGITEDESWAIFALTELVLEPGVVVRDIVSREWFVDGITADESLALEALGSISAATMASSQLAAMPFLDTVEPADSHALMSLDSLLYQDPEAFKGIMAYPTLADGISDNEALTVALLHDVHFANPGLVSTLLSPDSTEVEDVDSQGL